MKLSSMSKPSRCSLENEAPPRRSSTGLASAMTGIVIHNTRSGHFPASSRSRRSTMKAMMWEQSSYWFPAKQLERGRCQIFESANGSPTRFEASSSDLAPLLDDIDLRGARQRQARSGIDQRLSP